MRASKWLTNVLLPQQFQHHAMQRLDRPEHEEYLFSRNLRRNDVNLRIIMDHIQHLPTILVKIGFTSSQASISSFAARRSNALATTKFATGCTANFESLPLK